MTSASIVTYHTSHEVLKRLLDSIKDSPIEKLYVIDNSHSDELRDFFEEYPHVQYIYSVVNVGYGRGHNIAIRKSIKAGFKYHIVINPDVYWKGEIIAPMRDYMESHPEVGQLMPKVLYPDGETQFLCKLLPTPADLIMRRFLPMNSISRRRDEKYEMHWTGYDKIMDVPVLSGCFMVLRNEVLKKTGGFDERFFMYAEDVDLCRRIGEVSKTVFFPKVSIYHEYGKGSYKNIRMLGMHMKSIIKYFNKWGWFFDRKRKERNKTCIETIKTQEKPL